MSKYQWKELKDYVQKLMDNANNDIPQSCYFDVILKMNEIERNSKNKFTNLTANDWKETNEASKQTRGISGLTLEEYYNIPEVIKEKMNKDFLSEFKNKLDEIFNIKENADWSNTYCHLESSIGWDNAFKLSCIRFNCSDVYEYYNQLDWEESDLFDFALCHMLIDYGVIEKGEDELM